MVEIRVDPIRPPTLTLSPKELDEIEEMMKAGSLPPDFLERHFDAVDANVFGADAPKDKDGHRLEQGIGSPGNQTENSIKAYVRYAKYEEGYDEAKVAETVKRMRAELAATKKARAAATGGKRRAAGRQ